MGYPYERKKATVFTEFFALALLTTIGIVRYFNLHNTVKIGWLLVIGLSILITVYQLSFYLFFKSQLFKGAFIVFAAAFWAVLVFYISKLVRSTEDGLTWLLTIVTFSVMLLVYIHYHFKKLF